MRLDHLELWSWMGLEHVCLDDLKPGINLVTGPNGAGKSRIFEALQLVFFRRYKSGGAKIKKKVQSRDCDHPPRVLCRFTVDGVQYSIEKQLLKGAYARLQGDGQTLEDEAAESRLRELMEADQISSRGKISPENNGLWPLLWVPQHHSHRSPTEDMNFSARTRLDDLLGEEMGHVAAGPMGEKLLARAKGEYERYFNPKKHNAAREYKEVREAYSAAARVYDDILTRRNKTRDTAKQLGEDEQRLAALAGTLDGVEGELKTARAEHQEAQRLAGELQTVESEVSRRGLELEKATSALASRQSLDEELREARRAQADSAPSLEDGRTQNDRREERLKQAEAAMSSADAVVDAASRALANARTHTERVELEARLKAAADKLTEAELDNDAIGQATARLAQLPVDDEAMKGLRKAEVHWRTAKAELHAAAARVSVKALKDIEIDSDLLAAGDCREITVDKEKTLRLGDVAEVTVEPGGEDIQDRRDKYADAQRELDERLEAVRLDSVAAAAEQNTQRRAVEAELDRQRATLETRAPHGIEALRADCATLQAQLDAIAERSTQEDDDSPESPDVEAAEKRAADGLAAQSSARADRHAAFGSVSDAREHLAKLTAEAESLDAKLAELELRLGQAESIEVLTTARSEAHSALGQAERQRDVLADQTSTKPLDMLSVTVERLAKSHKNHERECRAIKESADQLRGALGNLDTDELHDHLQDARAALTRARAEHDRIQRKALAARTLLEAMNAARAESRTEIHSRLTERVLPYLRRILPGASLNLEEGWEMTGVQTSALGELDFEQLSGGIREQLALIVRFALAETLANDDTLPIVLDDPLVNTDPERLQTMIDIFAFAARNLQLIILSCHESKYDCLGEERRFRL